MAMPFSRELFLLYQVYITNKINSLTQKANYEKIIIELIYGFS